ncbi:hypothetical protein D3C71_1423460 [compost metagenome]
MAGEGNDVGDDQQVVGDLAGERTGQFFIDLPWVRRQREVVRYLQAPLLQMALQMLGGLREVALPPVPVIGGAGQ